MEEIKPTVTLAQLYESQNQFVDALLIYRKILASNPENREIIEGKIKALEAKIFSKQQQEYDPLINKIFSAEEKEYFAILSHHAYKEYSKSSDNTTEDIDVKSILKDEE
ncbi:MAG: hypothetical protein B6D62_03935 [Candidatus Cloacimonas sp. 4484_275]|nr:MAG: hypothetical protein B6D62_03935 [Candidatus Cloacimonas sp. 4484_275]